MRRPLPLLAASLLLASVPARGATVAGTATVGGKPAAGAVVALEAPVRSEKPSRPRRAVMDQKNLTFVPSLLAVPRGTVVEFTNSDDVPHNVFSPSEVAGRFDLGTYGPGASKTVTLDRAGEVLVLCNIHMEMEAHIVVLDTPHFATTTADGAFRIEDVPPGRYTAKLWRGRWLETESSVEVGERGDVRFDVTAEAR